MEKISLFLYESIDFYGNVISSNSICDIILLSLSLQELNNIINNNSIVYNNI